MRGDLISKRGMEALNEKAGGNVFPLQTIQSMAERWGKSRQSVAMAAQRDPRFPRQLDGIIEQTAKTPRVYPLYEVERYEQEKGLI